jgi:hypothetical protein
MEIDALLTKPRQHTCWISRPSKLIDTIISRHSYTVPPSEG